MKKAILVVSFGTNYAETRERTIGACENKIREAFPDYDVYRAFTSNMVINKLAKRDGIHVDTVEVALLKLESLGYEEVIIQSLHIIHGEEYEKIITQAQSFQNKFSRLIIGEPLLQNYDDYVMTIAALVSQMPVLQSDEAVVLMGHGTEHYSFSAYACLDHMLRDTPIYLGCVESYPSLDIIMAELEEDHKKKVHLMPFMLVSGDHAINDMASDNKDSWKTQLMGEGFETVCYLQGLGENPAIQAQFVNRIARALEKEAVLHG
ncbi:sirohydrochlorin cobaltochelatase [Bacillus massiliigorillae]|uniref:sirohydrochlorin cobaltochelatase n=1 Tax=Bacillus massiliigorillae TaxID=1243664 RepID=UPI0003A7C64D|nr:sirohydrochlorin cobaltochelatase [Bacillus massiliigorillae]